MDTVTRAKMAIAVAEEGGIGIIDRGFCSGNINPQVREVQIVTRKQHGVISDPYTIVPAASLTDARRRGRATPGAGAADDARPAVYGPRRHGCVADDAVRSTH